MTLVEVMITVVVVTILATISFPLGYRFVEGNRRMEAEAMMLQIHQGEKAFFARNRAYWIGGNNAVIRTPPEPSNSNDINGNLDIYLDQPVFYNIPDFSANNGYTAVTSRKGNNTNKVCITQNGVLIYDSSCP